MPICFFHRSTPFKGAIIRKRVYTASFFCCFVLAAVFIWNGAIALGALACIAGAFFAFLRCRTAQRVKRQRAGICGCGKGMAYHDGVTFEACSRWTTTRTNSTCSEIVATTYADIRIHYPCPGCGSVKVIRHMICTGEVRKNTAGEVLQERQFSAQQAIRDFFEDLTVCT